MFLKLVLVNLLIQAHHTEYLFAAHSFCHVKILKLSLEVYNVTTVTMGHNLVCNLVTMYKRQKKRRPVWFACSVYKMEQIPLKRLFYALLLQTEKSGQAHWRMAKSANKSSSMPVQLNSTHLILATMVPCYYNTEKQIWSVQTEKILSYISNRFFNVKLFITCQAKVNLWGGRSIKHQLMY